VVFLFSIGRVRSYTLGLRGGFIIHDHSVLNADMLLRKGFSEYSTLCPWSCYSQHS